jgi:hypothetical protein
MKIHVLTQKNFCNKKNGVLQKKEEVFLKNLPSASNTTITQKVVTMTTQVNLA